MNEKNSFVKKSKLTLALTFLLLVSLCAEIIYLQNMRSMSGPMLIKKQIFVGLTGLPDLAFANEDSYVRDRSLVNVADIYKNDSSLREYSKSTFSLNHKGKN